jgi:hypothetical protein
MDRRAENLRAALGRHFRGLNPAVADPRPEVADRFLALMRAIAPRDFARPDLFEFAAIGVALVGDEPTEDLARRYVEWIVGAMPAGRPRRPRQPRRSRPRSARGGIRQRLEARGQTIAGLCSVLGISQRTLRAGLAAPSAGFNADLGAALELLGVE